jgi:hypothetical protein
MAELRPLVDRTQEPIDNPSTNSLPETSIQELIDASSLNGSADAIQGHNLPATHRKLAKGRKNTKGALAVTSWMPEIVSYLISLFALGAIVAVVRARDRKPLPDWPSPFTINFVVSVFTSILKAAMMMPVSEALSELKWLWFADSRLVSDMDDFDLASRGPRGSLQFLFRLSRNKLASLGALITVLGLAIDPLTQTSGAKLRLSYRTRRSGHDKQDQQLHSCWSVTANRSTIICPR